MSTPKIRALYQWPTNHPQAGRAYYTEQRDVVLWDEGTAMVVDIETGKLIPAESIPEFRGYETDNGPRCVGVLPAAPGVWAAIDGKSVDVVGWAVMARDEDENDTAPTVWAVAITPLSEFDERPDGNISPENVHRDPMTPKENQR